MNDLKTRIKELISNYPAIVIGFVAGLLVGLLIITFGLVRVFILFVCILLGLLIGYIVTIRMKEK